MHKTASLADEDNSAYCQSSDAHNIKHNLCKLALRGHLNTDAQVGLELGTFCSRERCLNRSATAPYDQIDGVVMGSPLAPVPVNLFWVFMKER